jgi:hypothetical protein
MKMPLSTDRYVLLTEDFHVIIISSMIFLFRVCFMLWFHHHADLKVFLFLYDYSTMSFAEYAS